MPGEALLASSRAPLLHTPYKYKYKWVVLSLRSGDGAGVRITGIYFHGAVPPLRGALVVHVGGSFLSFGLISPSSAGGLYVRKMSVHTHCLRRAIRIGSSAYSCLALQYCRLTHAARAVSFAQ